LYHPVAQLSKSQSRGGRGIGGIIQAVAVGGGPVGEKLGELGDAAVGALVPNPCSTEPINRLLSSDSTPPWMMKTEAGLTVQDDEGHGLRRQ
jgi:hypothetical protein